MAGSPKIPLVVTKMFEADARQLVPVSDEIGGISLYLGGRPAYYVLNGEWFQAVQHPQESSGSSGDWVAQCLAREAATNEIVSTS